MVLGYEGRDKLIMVNGGNQGYNKTGLNYERKVTLNGGHLNVNSINHFSNLGRHSKGKIL